MRTFIHHSAIAVLLLTTSILGLAQTRPADVQVQIALCSSSNDRYVDFEQDELFELIHESENDQEFEANFKKAAESDDNDRRACLDKLMSREAGNVAAQNEIGRAIVDRPAWRHYQSVRSRFERNPREALEPLFNNVDLGTMSRIVEQARKVMSLLQACGTFDATLPPRTSSSQVDAFNRRYQDYYKCVENRRTQLWNPQQITLDRDMDSFLNDARMVGRLGRYTCVRLQSANCLPEATYRRVSEVMLSPGNLAAVREGKKRYERLPEEVDSAQELMRRLNQRIEDAR